MYSCVYTLYRYREYDDSVGVNSLYCEFFIQYSALYSMYIDIPLINLHMQNTYMYCTCTYMHVHVHVHELRQITHVHVVSGHSKEGATTRWAVSVAQFEEHCQCRRL